jgi:Na+-driven multidrug efflux pump
MLLEKSQQMQEESRQFYKSLFTIVGPIALQNLISAAVGSADVIMLGYVGQSAIAAVNLASYIQFILFLFFIGLSSGS